MNSENLLSAIFSQNADAAAEAFNGALAAKIADALEVKKVEVASNFISTPAAPEVEYSEPVETASEAPAEVNV
jgi:hypothetical protein